MKKFIVLLFMLMALVALVACSTECVHDWSEATCQGPSKCSKCQGTVGEKGNHIWEEATCLSPKKCTTCGTTEGDYGQHNYVGPGCVTSKVCSYCEDKILPSGHSYQYLDCVTAPICSACQTVGKAREHKWVEADCENAKTCTTCKETEGEALGHVLTEGDCDVVKSCTVCSFVQSAPIGHSWVEVSCQAPKHCTQCSKTEGEKLTHKWVEHEYIEPSCIEGKQIYKCQVGGETREVPIAATIAQHLCDETGLCSTCSTKFDPNRMTLSSIAVSGNLGVKNAGIFKSSETGTPIYKSITMEDVNMPVIVLDGNLPTSKGANYVNVKIKYNDGENEFECIAAVKVQGASSAGYPKKNYNIKLYDETENGLEKHKIKLVKGWGKQFKYCLKANYVDFSQARNVVSGQLYGDVIDAREIEDELSDLPSGGAIDGFPVLVFNNGNYVGLYTFNIPKDKWMFDMKDSDEKNQAIVMANTWNDTVAFRATIGSGFEVEYASNEDSTVDNSTSWVLQSLNELIKFTMNNNGEDFVNGISQYADVDKCIDSMLFTFVICADDNISKNILWATYDGKVWFSSMYDMDGTWGMRWNGKIEFDENTHLISNLADGSKGAPERNHNNYNLLWEKIYINFYDRVVERYQQLRKTALSIENITTRFGEFFAKIPDIVYQAEREKWTGVPTNEATFDHFTQIIDFATKRLAKMDTILVTNENGT